MIGEGVMRCLAVSHLWKSIHVLTVGDVSGVRAGIGPVAFDNLHGSPAAKAESRGETDKHERLRRGRPFRVSHHGPLHRPASPQAPSPDILYADA